ncbi:hypothetical protein ACJMK2_018242 [Sinanodonta woodiana]|uniref:F-box domain-containing protein n=1 Tax=Sinanodonta woodiana TaxID=1069815 RepID=A0ABD3UGF5_SINWO
MAFSKTWLLDKDHGAFVDFSDVAPAPCKDFFHVYVNDKQIIFRYWKIVPPTRADSKAPPIEMRNSYDDFLHDDRCHSEIQRLAGTSVLNYLKNIAHGQLDYLPRLPQNALLKIIFMLELEDILRLSRVSKQFRELCYSEELWLKIYRINSETPITPELEDLAKSQGWKRLFFTNKLQLQMQLRRQRRQHGHGAHGQAFITSGSHKMDT